MRESLWHSPNFTPSVQATLPFNEFENFTFIITVTNPIGLRVKTSSATINMKRHRHLTIVIRGGHQKGWWHTAGSYYDGLMQKKRNSCALTMELRLFCIKPSISLLPKKHKAD